MCSSRLRRQQQNYMQKNNIEMCWVKEIKIKI
jgi:hypothetical protein